MNEINLPKKIMPLIPSKKKNNNNNNNTGKINNNNGSNDNDVSTNYDEAVISKSAGNALNAFPEPFFSTAPHPPPPKTSTASVAF